jgi:CheY-like chemotaxis protein
MAKVLLIDDDEALRTITRAILADKGHVVIEAQNAAEGLEAAQTLKPDVILSDFLMPGVLEDAGKKLFEELAADSRTKNIPVIIMTGLPKMTVKAHVPESLWPFIVNKPFDYLRLHELIAEALKRKNG